MMKNALYAADERDVGVQGQGGHVQHRVGDVLGVEGRLRRDRSVGLRYAAADDLGHVRRGVADVDLAAGDVEVPAVERQRLGQARDRVLGGRVADAPRPGAVRGDRAVVDDPPAARALGLHRPHGVVRAQECAGEVDVHGLLPPGRGDLVRRARRAEDARVVDEQVDAAWRTVSKSAATESGTLTSVGTTSADSGGAATAAVTVSCSWRSRRPANATRHRAASNFWAMDRPSPDPAPVTTATPAEARSVMTPGSHQDGRTDRPAWATSMSWV